jgi:hypothetical protein
LAARLKEAGEKPDENGLFSTRAITQTLYGSLFAERLRKTAEEADKVAIANAVSRGELLSRSELMQAMAHVADAMVGVIENSGLSREDKEQIRRNLASIPIVIAGQAARQDKRRGPGTNGAHQADFVSLKTKRGRPRKRESKHPEAEQSET